MQGYVHVCMYVYVQEGMHEVKWPEGREGGGGGMYDYCAGGDG